MGIEAADHGFERFDLAATAAQTGNKTGSDESLADFGSGRSDENGGQGERHPQTRESKRSVTTWAKRSISRSAWSAEKAKRNRADPSGTLGGRMATTRKPSSSSIFEALSAASA